MSDLSATDSIFLSRVSTECDSDISLALVSVRPSDCHVLVLYQNLRLNIKFIIIVYSAYGSPI